MALMTYEKDGYEIVHQLLKPKDCAILNWYAACCPEGPHIQMAHREHAVFHALLRFQPVVWHVKRLVGPRVVGITSEYFFGRPGTKGFNPHQDNHYVQTTPGAMVSCWIALTDVSAENGCLYVYPGTHKNALLDLAGADPENRVDPVQLPPLAGKMLVPLSAGDAIFMSGELIHGSLTNRSDRGRESITLGYIAKGAPFRAGRHGRVAVDVG